MSLVAVVQRKGDRPGEIPETRVVPVGMPQDVRFGAYFPAPPPPAARAAMFSAIASAGAFDDQEPMMAMLRPPHSPAQGKPRGMGAIRGLFRKSNTHTLPTDVRSAESSDDILMALASQLEPDGGMPGKDISERAARSVTMLLAFVAAGQTVSSGPFRSHVGRLVEFLKLARDVPDRKIIEVAISAAATGKVPAGDWLALARESAIGWGRVEKELRA
jgi:hypothetical protein